MLPAWGDVFVDITGWREQATRAEQAGVLLRDTAVIVCTVKYKVFRKQQQTEMLNDCTTVESHTQPPKFAFPWTVFKTLPTLDDYAYARVRAVVAGVSDVTITSKNDNRLVFRPKIDRLGRTPGCRSVAGSCRCIDVDTRQVRGDILCTN